MKNLIFIAIFILPYLSLAQEIPKIKTDSVATEKQDPQQELNKDLLVTPTDTLPMPEFDIETLMPTARDPFSKPKSLLDREQEAEKPKIDSNGYVDIRIEAIRRYPLSNYRLVGIIYDVASPKAMIRDQDNNMHMVQKNQRIGNREGVVVQIERGELVIEEKGQKIVLKMQK